MPRLGAAALRMRLYPEMAFGGYSRWDGTVAFYTRLRAVLKAEWHVLDYGCGIGAHISDAPGPVRAIQALKGQVRELIGADISEEGGLNPWLDRFVIVSGGTVPLESESIDACYCDWTLEHVKDVEEVFAELARLIRPGGYLFIRTPNRWHYSSLAASVLPIRTHASVRRWLGQFHTADDVFPVYYRCNTKHQLSRAFARHGFISTVYTHRGESHLAGSGRPLGSLGEAIERLFPSFLWHELHGFGVKLTHVKAADDRREHARDG